MYKGFIKNFFRMTLKLQKRRSSSTVHPSSFVISVLSRPNPRRRTTKLLLQQLTPHHVLTPSCQTHHQHYQRATLPTCHQPLHLHLAAAQIWQPSKPATAVLERKSKTRRSKLGEAKKLLKKVSKARIWSIEKGKVCLLSVFSRGIQL